MALDLTTVVGREGPTTTLHLDAGRLAFFARTIGETDPVHTSDEAARAAGLPGIPAPPTFLFAVGLETPDPFQSVLALGVDLRTLLHGEQKFTYHAPAFAGDDLTMTSRFTDAYEKKGGALVFLVQTATVTNQRGELVAELEQTLVVRQLPGVDA